MENESTPQNTRDDNNNEDRNNETNDTTPQPVVDMTTQTDSENLSNDGSDDHFDFDDEQFHDDYNEEDDEQDEGEEHDDDDENDEDHNREEEENDDDEEEEQQTTNTAKMGCKHYQRNCQVKSPCCQRYFWCRLCHNEQVAANLEKYAMEKYKSSSTRKQEAEAEAEKNKNDNGSVGEISNSNSDAESLLLWCQVEEMDRYAIACVKCMICDNEQSVVDDETNFRNCVKCHTQFARYACFKCKFYNDDPSAEIYHCDECGLCRRGKQSDYVHCHTCSACMPQNHKCVAQSLHRNCVVCLEYLFTSTSSSSILPNCGHAIHSKCLSQLYRKGAMACPLCSKSLYKRDEIQSHYDRLDAEIQNTPMPDEYKNMTVNIICNDCLATSTVPFHIFGFKCTQCHGYNTKRK